MISAPEFTPPTIEEYHHGTRIAAFVTALEFRGDRSEPGVTHFNRGSGGEPINTVFSEGFIDQVHDEMEADFALSESERSESDKQKNKKFMTWQQGKISRHEEWRQVEVASRETVQSVLIAKETQERLAQTIEDLDLFKKYARVLLEAEGYNEQEGFVLQGMAEYLHGITTDVHEVPGYDEIVATHAHIRPQHIAKSLELAFTRGKIVPGVRERLFEHTYDPYVQTN